MNVLDYLLVFSFMSVASGLVLVLLVLAWENFENTELGKMILDKFKRKEESKEEEKNETN